VSSLLLWPRWIQEWLQVVFGYRQYSTPPLVSYLLGNRVGPRLGPILIAALLMSAIFLAWRKRHALAGSTEFSLTLSALLAITTITLLPGHAVYDQVTLLPGILLIAFSSRPLAGSNKLFRVILCVSALALFWQWIAAPFVILLRPLLSHQAFVSTVLMVPIRTAAAIPFCVLALLVVMMRHTKPWGRLYEKTIKFSDEERAAL
jgi:hypothetical protein